MGILVDTMSTEELPTVSAILGEIYLTNPLNTAAFGNNLRSNEALFRLCLEFAPGIHRYVAKDNGQIVGVMGMTEWPDCQTSPFSSFLIPPTLHEQFKGSRLRMKKWFHMWEQKHPKEHHWHFGPFGVLPERQRQGIGSQLLAYFCEHLDRLGAAAYLETDKLENVSLYQRFGFTITSEAVVLGVPNWFMWRHVRKDTP